MFERSILILSASLLLVQQAAAQSGYTDIFHPRKMLIASELHPDARLSARVYGEGSTWARDGGQQNTTLLAEIGPADAETLAPKAESAAGHLVDMLPAAENSQSIVPRATNSQIDSLIAVQRSQALELSGVGASEGVGACVDRNLLAVDRGNQGWNPNDSRWDAMRSVITQDCAAHANRIKTEIAPVLKKTYLDVLGRGYETRLSNVEADYLIRFYESAIGRRYLAFQKRLTVVGRQHVARPVSRKAGPHVQATTPDILKARMEMLRLSTTFAMLIVATQDARRTGVDASGAPAVGMMMSMVAEGQGDALDQIRQQYSPDLHAFAAFVESPAEADELRALHEATVAESAVAVKLAMEVNPELNGDLKRWRDLYKSLPKDNATVPAADFVLLQHTQIPPPPWDTRHYLLIADAVPSSKGGVLIAGRQGNSRSWTFYVSGTMHLQWSNVIDQGWPGHGALAIADARDGGFWVAGYGQSIDTEDERRKGDGNLGLRKAQDATAFNDVSYLDGTGRSLWQRALFTGARRSIHCVKEGSDGLFVSGDESLLAIVDGGAASGTTVNVPWVAKLDKQGGVLWERRVAAEGGAVLVSMALPIPTCTALEAGDDGGVTLAAVVKQIEGAKRDADGLHVPAQYEKQIASKGTLVAKFDGAGNELNTIKLDATAVDKTFLFATSGGFSVVDHLRPTADPKQLRGIQDIYPVLSDLMNRSGVRITDLSRDLRKVDEKLVTIPPFFDRLSAVLPLRAGGYFMGGSDGSRSSIVWVAPSGSIGAILKMDPSVGLGQCNTMAFGRADADGDLLLFCSGSAYDVFRLRPGGGAALGG
ncbi:hypothetical protein [Ralstonia solanacearum]|uniref:hypothetical protein n=1 Tax=Ralstonia solanacearum TaxID=305 RepID=UPI000B09DA3E|nr:hypothetical protein [Ralstonia solanacearum]